MPELSRFYGIVIAGRSFVKLNHSVKKVGDVYR